MPWNNQCVPAFSKSLRASELESICHTFANTQIVVRGHKIRLSEKAVGRYMDEYSVRFSYGDVAFLTKLLNDCEEDFDPYGSRVEVQAKNVIATYQKGRLVNFAIRQDMPVEEKLSPEEMKKRRMLNRIRATHKTEPDARIATLEEYSWYRSSRA